MTHTFISMAQKPAVKEWQDESKVNRDGMGSWNINPLREKRGKMAQKRQNTGDTYLVKWRNFASMLRCRIHILVRAEPTSLVAPWTRQMKQTVILNAGITDHSCSSRHRTTVEQQYDNPWGQITKSGEHFEKSNSLLSDGYFLPEVCFNAVATRWKSADWKRQSS